MAIENGFLYKTPSIISIHSVGRNGGTDTPYGGQMGAFVVKPASHENEPRRAGNNRAK